MHVFSDDLSLEVDGSAATDTRCALPHESWTAGTPRPVLWPVVAARFVLPRSTRPTPHRAHTAACADARPTPEAARLHAPCASGPHAQVSALRVDFSRPSHAWRSSNLALKAALSARAVSWAFPHPRSLQRWVGYRDGDHNAPNRVKILFTKMGGEGDLIGSANSIQINSSLLVA